MTEASCENLEMAIVLPLGVVANQLGKIEVELRLLKKKSSDFAGERENSLLAGRIEARLGNIHEALDSIRDLVSGIEAHMRLSPRDVDTVYSHADRKPRPDRDD